MSKILPFTLIVFVIVQAHTSAPVILVNSTQNPNSLLLSFEVELDVVVSLHSEKIDTDDHWLEIDTHSSPAVLTPDDRNKILVNTRS